MRIVIIENGEALDIVRKLQHMLLLFHVALFFCTYFNDDVKSNGSILPMYILVCFGCGFPIYLNALDLDTPVKELIRIDGLKHYISMITQLAQGVPIRGRDLVDAAHLGQQYKNVQIETG